MKTRYYLLNNKLPIISNNPIEKVKIALIIYYGYNVKKLIEISKKEYEKILLQNTFKYGNYLEW